MSVLEIILYLSGGLILLFAGAEGLVRGSSALALRLGITPLVVGLTVVAFGTSAPELLVSIEAALKGTGDIAVGNVIGSNIANIALILGLSAVIRPMAVQAVVIKREIPIMIGISILLFVLLLDKYIGLIEGILFVTLLILYIFLGIYLSKKETDEKVKTEFESGLPKPSKSVLLSIVFVVAGFLLLIIGANIFVDGAISLAEMMGISQVIIGLTVVAFGTSLPELITSIVAAFKDEVDIAIGNIVGSNVFNILSILGISSIITPLHAEGVSIFDLSIMLLVAVILWPLSRIGFKLNRWEGGLLFAGYVGYMVYLYSLT
jgi:cation:H+ antiporter